MAPVAYLKVWAVPKWKVLETPANARLVFFRGDVADGQRRNVVTRGQSSHRLWHLSSSPEPFTILAKTEPPERFFAVSKVELRTFPKYRERVDLSKNNESTDLRRCFHDLR